MRVAFVCPVHGEIDEAEGRPERYDATGLEHYPFYRVLCRECGRPGSYKCDGSTALCKMKDGRCTYHSPEVPP